MVYRIDALLRFVTFAIVVLTFVIHSSVAASSDIDFSLDIQPILAAKCFACHGPDGQAREAELRLDLEEGAKAKVIVPGDPDGSELIARISSEDGRKRMPPAEAQKEPLTAAEVAMFREWIASGAEWARHWAFVGPERGALPEVTAAHWPRNGIDHFVLARLEREGLRPALEASREMLIRRVSFDLTGLPPTVEEVEAFVLDNGPDAYERLVDRLLASPRYGENMARVWLDLARYADTNGYQNDYQRMMWPWRDWVIDAYNANMPFDQFAIEQLAGDLLPDATQSQRVATGFNRNNRANTEGGSIEDEWRIENIVDRVETTSITFLGLSMGCARCHDHKFDPISQKEFYQFFSFFNHTEDRGFYSETRGNTGPIESLPSEENEARMAEFDERIAVAKAQMDEVDATRDETMGAWKRAVLDAKAPEMDAAGLNVAFGSAADAYEFGPDEKGRINLGDSVAFERDAAFTVVMWVRPDGAGALFSKMDDGAAYRGVDTLVTDKGELAVHLVHAWDGNAIKVETDRRLKMGVWSQVCVRYDGSGKAAGVQIYVNGAAATLSVEKDSLTESIATAEPLRLGSRGASEYLPGAVASFQHYDRVVDEETLAAAFLASAKTLFDVGAPDLGDFFLAIQGAATLLDDVLALKHDGLKQDAEASVRQLENQRREYVDANVPTVMVMRELEEPRPTYLLKRGAYDAADTSEDLQPAVPAFLPPLTEDAPRNRLGLAEWIADPANPLTARVTVNRFWEQLFGRGLVKTLEDFGVQGAPPTHGKLLDWLATEFVGLDWDMKAMLKTMVMSATYRQSSELNAELRERDPENVLLARGPRFRLPAEMVRDNALAVSGLLSKTMGGPPIKPYQPDGLWEELAGGASIGPYKRDSGEDLYRRSLYIFRKRTVPPPMLTTFDSPGWDLCRARRGTTNTPLQALALMNDEAYVEASRKLAERMIAEAPPEARAVHGFRIVTGRAPDHGERVALEKGLERYRETYAADGEAALALISVGESARDESMDAGELAAFTMLANVLLNLDEAVTKE